MRAVRIPSLIKVISFVFAGVTALVLANPAGYLLIELINVPGGPSFTRLDNALSQVDLSSDNTLHQNISALLEAYKAPADNSVLDRTASTIKLIASDYFAGPLPMVETNLAPKNIRIQVKYAGAGDLGANAWRYDDNSAPTPRHSFDLLVTTTAEGEWAFEKRSFGIIASRGMAGRARDITSMMVVGHELGHTIYHSAYEAYGARSIDRVMNRAGIKLNPQQSAEALRLLHGTPWTYAAVNESFADSMGLIYLAKKLSRLDFVQATKGLRKQRQKSEQTLFQGLDMDLAQAARTHKPVIATHFKPDTDTHMTYDAVQAVADMGYEKLRALSPEQIPQTALDCAHEGFFRMAGRHPDTFAMLLAPASQPIIPDMFIAAGLSLALSGGSFVEQLNAPAPPVSLRQPNKSLPMEGSPSPTTFLVQKPSSSMISGM